LINSFEASDAENEVKISIDNDEYRFTFSFMKRKPLMKKKKMPYLDVSYDSSVQPAREATIRTFMYKAQRHFERYGNKRLKQGPEKVC
jgi:hypothetical protein